MRINRLAWAGGLPLILLPLAAQAVILLPRVLAAAMCVLVIAGVSGNLSLGAGMAALAAQHRPGHGGRRVRGRLRRRRAPRARGAAARRER